MSGQDPYYYSDSEVLCNLFDLRNEARFLRGWASATIPSLKGRFTSGPSNIDAAIQAFLPISASPRPLAWQRSLLRFLR